MYQVSSKQGTRHKVDGDMPAGKADKYHQLEETDWSFLRRLVDDVSCRLMMGWTSCAG